MLCRRGLGAWLRRRGGVGEGLVDDLEKLRIGVLHLDKRSAFAAGGNDEDGWGLRDAGAPAQFAVGLDLRSQLALRIHGKGKGNAVALRELLSELAELVGVVDRGLAGGETNAGCSPKSPDLA